MAVSQQLGATQVVNDSDGKAVERVTETLPLDEATQPRPHIAPILSKTVLQVAP